LQADIIAELMDSLGIGKAFIMGSSAGGSSTIQFALRHPERCRGVILVSAISHEHPPISWYQDLVLDLFFNSDFLYWNPVSCFPSSFHTAFGIPPGVQAALTPAQREAGDHKIIDTTPRSRNS
jgi:pimeloyl-ACP methyl ester carboxylesterase